MLNLLDQLLGLTAKVIGFLLDWPFLLFVFLVWLVSRYRDQLGSVLDRRGTVRRSDLSSAIREELDPLTKDIGDLKPDVSTLRTKVAGIEAKQSEYATERFLEPIGQRVKALEVAVEKMQSDVDRLAGIDFQEQLSSSIEPVDKAMESFRRDVEQLTSRLDPVSTDVNKVKQGLEDLSAGFQPVQKEMDSLRKTVEQVESQLDAGVSSDSFQQLQGDLEQFREELGGLNDAVAGLKSDVEAQAKLVEAAPAQLKQAASQADLIPLRVMKDALASTRWEWRRVKKLASIAGLSEDKATEMLENDPELTVKKDDWGRRVAKLSKK